MEILRLIDIKESKPYKYLHEYRCFVWYILTYEATLNKQSRHQSSRTNVVSLCHGELVILNNQLFNC